MAVIIICENKISKNTQISLNKFYGYYCALCGFVCLKVINSFHDFIMFNLRETKRKIRVTVFLYCNYGSVEPIFPSVLMILKKNLFKIDAVFLSLSTMLPSSKRMILSI